MARAFKCDRCGGFYEPQSYISDGFVICKSSLVKADICPLCRTDFEDWFKSVNDHRKGSGYECFHCGSHAVNWDSDFNFEDYSYEGEGVVHICHCANCGAEVEYRVRTDTEETDG